MLSEEKLTEVFELCGLDKTKVLAEGNKMHRKDPWRAGYLEGVEVGKEEGFEEGYNEGYEEGFERGCDEGYDNGFDDGSDAGYDEGFKDGTNW